MSGNAQARFQTSGDGREQRIADGVSRWLAGARRSSEIDEEHREVEGLVAAGPLDGLRHAVHQQETIGQSGERIGHHLHGDVRLRAGQADRAPGIVPDDRTATRHPSIRAVLVAQAVSTLERGRVPGSRDLDLAATVRRVSSGWTRWNQSSGVLPTSWSSQPTRAIHRGEK